MRRNEAIRGRIARLWIDGYGARRIARILSARKPISKEGVAFHVRRLLRQGVILDGSGGRRWGPAAYLYRNLTPPPEGVPPDLTPPPPPNPQVPSPTDLHTGWQFTGRLLKPVLLPLTGIVGNGSAFYKKWLPLGTNLSADVFARGKQENGMVRARTLDVSLHPFELPASDRENGDEVAEKAALLAVERFCADMGVGVFEVKVSNVGECVNANPELKGLPRTVICPDGPVEFNNSKPPGPAVEYTMSPHGKQDALDAYKTPDLLRELTRTLSAFIAQNGKALPALIQGQTAIIEALQQRQAIDQAILETLLSIQNGTAPSRPDSPRRMT